MKTSMIIIPCADNGEPMTSFLDGTYCPVYFW